MPFIIPNATDTVSGQKYVAVDQSEPDSLDFQILGDHSSGVLSGCVVSAQVTPNLTVAVETGFVVVSGTAYELAGTSALTLPTSPTTNRFDVVVARLSEGSVSLLTISGSEDANNPTFPRTTDRTLSYDPGSTSLIDMSTDVVLAAVYRVGGTVITTGHIVDKRVMVKGTVNLRGTAAPASSIGSDGDLYYQTVVTDSNSSGLYVKRDSSWTELGKASVDPGVPIGTIIMWPSSSTTPNSAVWKEADGSAVLIAGTYNALYNVIGTAYNTPSPGAGYFRLPDFRGHYLAGLPVGGSRQVGESYGSAEIQLSVENLPAHSHSLAVSTSTVTDHTHSIAHGHVGGTSGMNSLPHTHAFSGTTQEVTARTKQGVRNNFTGTGYVVTNTNESSTSFGSNVPHSHGFSGTTNEETVQHSHSFEVGSVTGSGVSGGAGAHGHSVSGSTNTTGSGTPVSLEPLTHYIRFFIRYA